MPREAAKIKVDKGITAPSSQNSDLLTYRTAVLNLPTYPFTPVDLFNVFLLHWVFAK